jgi:hypothetical protein
MALVSFFVTPTSITIYDGSKNRVVVRKATSADFKKAELTPEISVEDTRAQGSAQKLSSAIIKFLTQKSKDSFQKRFNRLHKFLSSIETHSFETLKNRLEKELEPKTEGTSVVAEDENLEVEAV